MDLETRLARLRGAETTKAGVAPEKPTLSASDKAQRKAEYIQSCFDAFAKRQGDPAYPEELREPRIQPENDPKPFVIGQPSRWPPQREALPNFQWPNPGQPVTPELEEQERRHDFDWWEGHRHLNDLIRIRGYELLKEETGKDMMSGLGAASPYYPETLAAARAWLSAYWSAKNMKAPSDEQIDEWARERTEGDFKMKFDRTKPKKLKI
jgi:hypothetical protein